VSYIDETLLPDEHVVSIGPAPALDHFSRAPCWWLIAGVAVLIAFPQAVARGRRRPGLPAR